MRMRPAWSYAQARLQARHGERLQESDWRALEAARSLDQYLERSRATSLRRFTERLNAGMSSHTMERVLRAAWRDYVAEVAGWGAPDWHAAILWTAPLPDLPAIDVLLRGEAPGWASQDAALAHFLTAEHVTREKSALTPLLPLPKREKTLPARWFAHWRSLLPQGAPELPILTRLAATIEAHSGRLSRAGPQESSAPYRRELMQAATRMFRRHAGSPVAAFCHLLLVALDLERLRGGLVRRQLFEALPGKEAA